MGVSTATGSNQYGKKAALTETGFLVVTLNEHGPDPRMQEVFGYRHLGRLDNDVQVVETMEWSGGGTGRFLNLAFPRLIIERIAGVDRLLLRFVDEAVLGDRLSGEILLRGDHVFVKSEPRYPGHGLQEQTNIYPRL